MRISVLERLDVAPEPKAGERRPDPAPKVAAPQPLGVSVMPLLYAQQPRVVVRRVR